MFTAHGWAFSGRGGASGAVYTTAERAVAPLSDAIVCVSNHDLKLAQEHHIKPRGELHVIHNGVDAPTALPYRRPPGERLVLGCTARLAPPKDLITLLDALVQPGCEQWELRVFGDGPARDQIEQHRDALSLGDRVALLGNRDDVTAQLGDCEAFALAGFGSSVHRALHPERRHPHQHLTLASLLPVPPDLHALQAHPFQPRIFLRVGP